MEYENKVIEAFKTNQPDMEMTPEDARLLMSLLMSKDPSLGTDVNKLDKTSDVYMHFQPVIESFISQVFLKRIEACTNLKISLGALIILLLYMETPRNAVIYTHYLDYKLQPNTLVTLTVFGEKAFPWGMFSPVQLDNIWAAMQPEKKPVKKLKWYVRWYNSVTSWISVKFGKTR